MRTYIALLFVFLCGFKQCMAQQTLEKLTYQLANDMLMDLHPQTNVVSITRGANGNYQAVRPRPASGSDEPMLLVDRPNSIRAAEDFALSGNGTAERNSLLEYFSEADIDYMRSQVPMARQFVFKQTGITQAGVKVVMVDTLMALNKRLDWKAPDTLQQRYGSRRVHGLGGFLFSLDHRKAVTVESTDDGWNVYVYENTGSAWYRKAELQKGVY